MPPTLPSQSGPAPRANYAPAHTAISDTDSDTISSFCEPLNYENDDELQHLEPAEVDEHLFWAYQQAKIRWRRQMQKPVSRVRRFIKKKGKGRGKGK